MNRSQRSLIALWGAAAVLLAPWVGEWLIARLRESSTFHLHLERLHP